MKELILEISGYTHVWPQLRYLEAPICVHKYLSTPLHYDPQVGYPVSTSCCLVMPLNQSNGPLPHIQWHVYTLSPCSEIRALNQIRVP